MQSPRQKVIQVSFKAGPGPICCQSHSFLFPCSALCLRGLALQAVVCSFPIIFVSTGGTHDISEGGRKGEAKIFLSLHFSVRQQLQQKLHLLFVVNSLYESRHASTFHQETPSLGCSRITSSFCPLA